MLTELEKKLEKSIQNVKELSCGLVELLESSVKDHFRWLMAINAGSLVWIISSIDRFTVAGVLFWKYFYIVIIVLQMISVVMFFWFNGMAFIITTQAKLAKMEINTSELNSTDNEKLIQEMRKIEKLVPKTITAVLSQLCFTLSFVFLAIYVISFIIKHN